MELSEEEQELLLKIKEKKKELRKKERREKKKDSDNSEEVVDNSDLEGVSGQDKSFDSIASFTGDVTNKVGNVGDSVKTGVSVSLRFYLTCFTYFFLIQRIFGDITNLIGSSTSTGQLQPNIGISFGLPQAAPGYAGYPLNPGQTEGTLGNPYYTAQQGLGVGPVNVNPLFSLQTGTNDDGEI